MLAGDVNHLKELRKKAAEGSEGLFMALDVDEELSIRVRFAWCPLFNQGFYMLYLGRQGEEYFFSDEQLQRRAL